MSFWMRFLCDKSFGMGLRICFLVILYSIEFGILKKSRVYPSIGQHKLIDEMVQWCSFEHLNAVFIIDLIIKIIFAGRNAALKTRGDQTSPLTPFLNLSGVRKPRLGQSLQSSLYSPFAKN
jgi:hypothetical protein